MMVNSINRVMRTILVVLIICAILLILVKKVVEPVFSDYIAQPISEHIVKKASDYLELPPSPETLREFKQEALGNDWYDSKGQLIVEYKQLPNATEGTITVSYSETFLIFMRLSSSSNKVVYYQEPNDTEFLVSTEDGDIEQMTTEYAEGAKTEQPEETNELTAESGSVESEAVIAIEETAPLQDIFPEETEQPSKDSAEVILANTETSSEEHGVALYVDGAYFDAYLNKQDALELAAFVENAKIIDLVTSRVVWESQ
ncbi:hypothetical protein H9647_16510 [Paenibacillus sp. Sa2BVA9]|uniref:Uncharacterized protein n=2 Tax=Paenibacillus gallinarum TaxID=2762232 RepID=A0ABR8T1M3_9BACL|nr:hypothetical protein [Paenibacillus gallinarum]